MSNRPATRMELLSLKQKKGLAEKGHSLLKRKRDALIREFFNKIKEYQELRRNIGGGLQEAYKTLNIAQAVSGVNRVKGLAASSKPAFSLAFSEKNLMGVHVPSIEITDLEGGFNASLIGTSYYVQQAREQFTHTVPLLVKLAELEHVLLSLADEIRATKRRVNALEFIQIPKMQDEVKHISSALAEMEREEFVRLKHIKAQLQED